MYLLDSQDSPAIVRRAKNFNLGASAARDVAGEKAPALTGM
jgi:hypothetical protein